MVDAVVKTPTTKRRCQLLKGYRRGGDATLLLQFVVLHGLLNMSRLCFVILREKRVIPLFSFER
jgi:hypothetical protein